MGKQAGRLIADAKYLLWLLLIAACWTTMAEGSCPGCTCQNAASCSTNGTSKSTTSVVKGYRPRGAFARILYDKQKADERLQNYDKTQVKLHNDFYGNLYQFPLQHF